MSDNLLVIREPIWKNKSIGINTLFTKKDFIRVRIDYTLKNGKRLYPDDYVISGEKLKKYPEDIVNGVRLRIVPISDLDLESEKTLF